MQAARTMLIVDDTRLARMMIRGFVAQTSPDWTILEAQDGSAARVQDAGLGFIPKPITEDKILTFLAHAEPDHA